MVDISRSQYVKSKEYIAFRSAVTQKHVAVEDSCEWSIYDYGPREVKSPLFFLPPTIGTADGFYRQVLPLGELGYRVILVNELFFYFIFNNFF